MSDPVSTVALAAAIGGVAGKVAEKAWESSQVWLSERFGSHSAAIRRQAEQNSAAFIVDLAERIKRLEQDAKFDKERLGEVERHPQFAALLQDTILSAAQTNESRKHSLLADLVASRLLAGNETTLALAAPLASSAISRCTSRQLNMLGLVCFIEEIRPAFLKDKRHFIEWLQVGLEPFETFEFEQIDARHLVALACVTYSPTSERSLSALLNMKSILLLNKFVDLEQVGVLEGIQIAWGAGLAGVSLTSVGSIVGGLVWNSLTGVKLPLPSWE